ncbi:unnamed protein product, partial [Laminaria digitata]
LSCDDQVVKGESYLRADYSISCKTSLHTFFEVYAWLMILLYPIGIPVLYAAILWKNRELLNPRLHITHDGTDDATTGADPETADHFPSATPVLCITRNGQAKHSYSSEDTVPSVTDVYRNAGPDLYYFEVIECGRRILLTGVLIFIKPHSPTQAAMACIFAFGSLLGFELLRPHMDPTDSWL